MKKELEMVGQDDRVEIYRLETEPFGTNAYILSCRESGEALLIDAPGDADIIKDKLKETVVQFILITHGHMDHIMALEDIYNSLSAQLAVHEGDIDMLPVEPDQLLNDGDILDCGELEIEVIHVPGHTAGSVCFRVGEFLISGDAIFPGGPGKTASADDFRTLLASIREQILTLPDQTLILPGHGDSTTVGAERMLIETFITGGYDDDLSGDVTW